MREWIMEMAGAARRLARAPVFTGVAVLTIGVGIGVFTSIFSLVDGVLLEPMPYDRPEELAWAWRDYVEADFPRGWLGGPDVVGLAEQTDVFTDVVAFRSGSANLSGADGGAPLRVRTQLSSAGLFRMLGVPLLAGREPTAEEDLPDGPAVAVLSHDLWSSRFAADPSIVGRTILLSGTSFEVVGVAPRDFRFVKHGSLVDPVPADIYLPLQVDLAQTSPGAGAYAALVRVAPGAHPDRVRAALEAAAEPANEFMAQYDASPVRLWTVGLTDDLVAGVRPALTALIASVTFLLLVLAANLATLLLGRAAAREQELGVRIALGAGRGRVVASVLAESSVLALLGGTLGVALAVLGTGLVVRLAPDDLPRLESVGMDGSILAVAVAVTVAMALAAGMLPALQAMRSGITGALKEGGRSGRSVRATRARGVLVAAQMALSLMLLVGATLTARAFAGLLDSDPGFDPERTLTFGVPLPGSLYGDGERFAFDAELRERIAALPGVAAVGGSNTLPLTLGTNQQGVSFPGAPGNTGDEREDVPLVDWFQTTPGFVEAAGLRLLAGRDFTVLDADTAAPVAIIDDVLAARFFPDGTAVGRDIGIFGDTATIVGVVDQARLYEVHADDRGQVYLPFQAFPGTSLSYAVRTAGEPESLAPAVRALVRELDPAVPLTDVRTLREIVDASLGQQRLSLTLIVGFALGALLLAVLGIYGVVSNTVARRTQEIGVRMALGADGHRVVRLVLGQGLRLAVLGAVLGVIGAVAASRIVEGVMVGVEPGDPLVYAAVAAALVSVAALASYVPARRATRIDPSESLRPE